MKLTGLTDTEAIQYDFVLGLQRPNTRRCGRATRTRKPCKQLVAGRLPACGRHITAEERAELAARVRARLNELDLAGFMPPTRPKCWTWNVTEVHRDQVVRGELSLFTWQQHRCAACGGSGDRLVLDHDHETGWVRGYLCHGCNISEAHGGRLFERYRRWNPARMLGLWQRYYSPFTGHDFGQLGGRADYWPLLVTADHRILFDAVQPGRAAAALAQALADQLDTVDARAQFDGNPKRS